MKTWPSALTLVGVVLCAGLVTACDELEERAAAARPACRRHARGHGPQPSLAGDAGGRAR